MLGLSVLEGGDNRAIVAEGAQHPPQVTYIEHAGNSSLGRVFDHVGIAVSDLAASERFYRTVLSVLGVEPSHADAELVEWEDWDIGPTDREHPVTRGLHVGFRAPSRAAVDAFWQAGIDAGYHDDGAPGPRTEYGPDYYGGFLLDPDGNSAEAVHGERKSTRLNSSHVRSSYAVFCLTNDVPPPPRRKIWVIHCDTGCVLPLN